jgi:hypothetical protein
MDEDALTPVLTTVTVSDEMRKLGGIRENGLNREYVPSGAWA